MPVVQCPCWPTPVYILPLFPKPLWPLWPALTAPGHEHTSPSLLSPSIIIFCQIGYHLFHRRQSDNLLNFFFPTPFRASVPSTMCTNPDLLLPLCAIFSNNQLALSQLFSVPANLWRKDADFCSRSGSQWACLNKSEWYNAPPEAF